MRKILKLTQLLAIIIILSGCSIYKSIDIGDINNVDFKGMIDNKVSLNMKIPISNPNAYKIRMKSMDLDLKINGNYIGKMTIANEIVIPPKSEDLQEFPVEIIVRNPLAAMTTMYKIRNAKSFEMDINGTIKVKALLRSKNIEVSEKQVIKL